MINKGSITSCAVPILPAGVFNKFNKVANISQETPNLSHKVSNQSNKVAKGQCGGQWSIYLNKLSSVEDWLRTDWCRMVWQVMLALSRQPSFLAIQRLKLDCGVLQLDTCVTRSEAYPAPMAGKQRLESPYEVDPKMQREKEESFF